MTNPDHTTPEPAAAAMATRTMWSALVTVVFPALVAVAAFVTWRVGHLQDWTLAGLLVTCGWLAGHHDRISPGSGSR